MSHLGEDQVYGPFRQGQGIEMRGGGGMAEFLIEEFLSLHLFANSTFRFNLKA